MVLLNLECMYCAAEGRRHYADVLCDLRFELMRKFGSDFPYEKGPRRIGGLRLTILTTLLKWSSMLVKLPIAWWP